MKIDLRPLNKGEVFPCSIQAAKAAFKHTPIHINFGYYSRQFGTFAQTPDRFYVRRNVKHRIIASMYMHATKEKPIVSFYVLKDSEYPPRNAREFEEHMLPLFLEHYETSKQELQNEPKTQVLLIEYDGLRFKVHRFLM